MHLRQLRITGICILLFLQRFLGSLRDKESAAAEATNKKNKTNAIDVGEPRHQGMRKNLECWEMGQTIEAFRQPTRRDDTHLLRCRSDLEGHLFCSFDAVQWFRTFRPFDGSINRLILSIIHRSNIVRVGENFKCLSSFHSEASHGPSCRIKHTHTHTPMNMHAHDVPNDVIGRFGRAWTSI